MSFSFNAAEVFQTAVEIEKNGLDFYTKASQAMSDPDMKELFASLAKDEVAHKKRFENILSDLPEELKRPTVSDPDGEVDLYIRALAGQHVFGPGDRPAIDPENLGTIEDVLKLAIQFEKDSVIFYLNMQENTSEGKAREIVTILVNEELRHVRRLSLKLNRCPSDVKACLINWPKS